MSNPNPNVYFFRQSLVVNFHNSPHQDRSVYPGEIATRVQISKAPTIFSYVLTYLGLFTYVVHLILLIIMFFDAGNHRAVNESSTNLYRNLRDSFLKM